MIDQGEHFLLVGAVTSQTKSQWPRIKLTKLPEVKEKASWNLGGLGLEKMEKPLGLTARAMWGLMTALRLWRTPRPAAQFPKGAVESCQLSPQLAVGQLGDVENLEAFFKPSLALEDFPELQPPQNLAWDESVCGFRQNGLLFTSSTLFAAPGFTHFLQL
jgi:hypothetical protein